MQYPSALVAATLIASATACASEVPVQETLIPQDQYAEVNGVTLHYLDWGGEGRLLLLVPGLWHTAHTYDAIAPFFVENYRVVAVTRREHGPSEKNTGAINLAGLVEDLAGFASLFTEEPAILVGQSYAGVELPRMASVYPDKVAALVLLDAVYDWPGWLADNQPPWPGTYDFSPRYDSFERLQEWFAATYPEMWGEPARSHLRSQTYLSDRGSVLWQLPWDGDRAQEFIEAYRTWTPGEYEGIKVPVLSLQAGFEGFFEKNAARRGIPPEVLDTARAWSRNIDAVLKQRGREMLLEVVPTATTVQFDDTHHWLHLQRPDSVVAVINAFLSTNRMR